MSGTLVHSLLAKIEWLNGLILHIRNGLKLASVCGLKKAPAKCCQSLLEYVLVECSVPGLQLSGSNAILALFLFRGRSTHQRPALVTVFPMDMLQVELLFLPKSGMCQNCPCRYVVA
jgi:hypothetical protein